MKRTSDCKGYYEKIYRLISGRLIGTIADPNQILKGKCLPGLYWWDILQLNTYTTVCAFVGDTENLQLSTLKDLTRWLRNEQTYHYLGILPEELGLKYLLVLHAEIDPAGIAYADKSRRLEAKRELIETKKPYTQYATTQDLSRKFKANVFDSCIRHKFRRQALLDAFTEAGYYSI